MNRDMEKNLIACLDNLEQGNSIDAALAGYPVEAAELRPYLETAGQISRLASLPTIAAQQQSQATFLAKAAALRSPQSSPTPIWFTLRRLMRPLASLAVILFLLGFTLVTMSAAALPGDGLYTVKLGIEEFRLMRASDPERILVLAEQFQQERLREVEALLQAGRTADVMFEGEIEAIDVATWIIAGLPVRIDNDTVIDGTPQVGELARVDGRTADGQLIASHITVLTGTPDPEEIPLPALIPNLERVETPEPSATRAVTQTPAEDQGDFAVVTPPATPADPPATSTPANDSDAENGNEDDGLEDDSDDGDDAGEENNNDIEEDEENSNEEDSDGGGDDGNDEGSDEPGDGDSDNDNEENEENSNEEDGNSGGDDGNDEGSDEPGDGDSDNDNEEDGENSNEEDGDSGGDDGEENNNDNEEDGENSNEEDGDSGGDDGEENDNDGDDSNDNGDDEDNSNEEDGGSGGDDGGENDNDGDDNNDNEDDEDNSNEEDGDNE